MLNCHMAKCTLTALVCSLSVSAYAIAASPSNVDVPAGELVSALKALATQSDVELVYQPEQLRDIRTDGVKGVYSVQEAIGILLKGTTLRVYTVASGAMVIAPVSTGQVSGAGQGVSGALPVMRLAQAEASLALGVLRLAQADHVSFSGTQEQQLPQDSSAQLEEIIVTAQKREERLIDVPQSVSVLSATQLANLGAYMEIGRASCRERV